MEKMSITKPQKLKTENILWISQGDFCKRGR